jgi:hypothetical protein
MPLSSLAVISRLQQLEDLEVALDTPKMNEVAPLLDLPTKLTRLALNVPSDSLFVISGLQQLQQLSVLLPGEAAAPLSDLPSGLTRPVLTPTNPPGWSQGTFRLLQQDPSQVRVLELSSVMVHVSALSSMRQLQKLIIDRCVLLPGGPCVLLPGAAPLSSRVSALLAVVGELTLLHELKLDLYFEQSEVEAVPSVAFSALTASSQLRVLHVELSHDTEVALPGPDVLQHMFPAGRLLGQLHTLVLGPPDFCPLHWCLSLADLALIAASCPALQTLSLVDVFELASEDSLRPLLDLTMLSSLRVGGAAWDDSAAGVVAQLTQLTSLEWVLTQDDSSRLSQAGLLQLAALDRLQFFSLDTAEKLDDKIPMLLDELLGERVCAPRFTPSDQVGCWLERAGAFPALYTTTLACLPSFKPAFYPAHA